MSGSLIKLQSDMKRLKWLVLNLNRALLMELTIDKYAIDKMSGIVKSIANCTVVPDHYQDQLKYLAFCFLLLGCGRPDYLSEVELSRFILDESNGLVKEINTNGFLLKIHYRPTDLMVAQEMRTVTTPSVKAIEEARKKYKGHYYFILSLSKEGKEVLSPAAQGMVGFSDLLQTLSFRMAEKVNLTTAKDTIFVADYIYNRTFGMSASTDLLFVFDKAKAKGQEFIQLNLDEFGLGIGSKSVRFDIDKLENSPKIYRPHN
jgi:hypothetical protein